MKNWNARKVKNLEKKEEGGLKIRKDKYIIKILTRTGAKRIICDITRA